MRKITIEKKKKKLSNKFIQINKLDTNNVTTSRQRYIEPINTIDKIQEIKKIKKNVLIKSSKKIDKRVNNGVANKSPFTLNKLKNNKNIKYFRNLPDSKDIVICSILSANINIIKDLV